MAKEIVILTGPVSSGKSTLSNFLVGRFGFHPFKTKEWLAQHAGPEIMARGAMQQFGESLDIKTNGTWVRDALGRYIGSLDSEANIVVDAARISQQIEAIRNTFTTRVVHIHLTAPSEVLAKRYKRRPSKGFKEFSTYEEVTKNKTESEIEDLALIADVVINTDLCTKEDVFVRAAAHLGLYGREYSRLVDVIIGGQYGSEGKGHIVSYLSGEYDILIRVGGPNAGHTVYKEPKPYTYHQLPSGTLSSEANLIIGPGAVINANELLKEIADCQIDFKRLSIDPQVMIIEQRDVNTEKALVKDIASTGRGVGAASARRILGRGKESGKNRVRLARDIKALKPFVRDTHEILEDALATGKRILLEGTQGTGLSLYHGNYPHVTSRDTTVAGCLAEAGISASRVRKIIMICRTYPIRVGNAPTTGKTSGYMSQPISWAEVSRRSEIPVRELYRKERTSTTKRERRVGEFDWALLRKAASLNGPTDIALTFADYITIKNRSARRLEQLSEETIQFIEEVERVTAAPVSLISTRFHSRSIIDRRAW